jgi:hypothetical protein
MKVKSALIKLVKKWYSKIVVLRRKHKLLVVMRNHAGENKSQEIIDFFESMVIRNYFSTANEQWQNELTESAINSIMMVSGTINLGWKADSGLNLLWQSVMPKMKLTSSLSVLPLGGILYIVFSSLLLISRVYH